MTLQTFLGHHVEVQCLFLGVHRLRDNVTLGDVCRIFELLHSGARLELDLLLPVVPHVDPGGAMQ